MMSLWRSLVFMLLVICTSGSLVGCSGAFDSRIPKDEVLKSKFYANSDNFIKVKNIFLSEGLYRVEIYNGSVDVLPKNKYSSSLSEKLMSLLKQLHINLVSTSFFKGTYDKIEEVDFIAYRDGLVTGGQAKGYSYFVKYPDSNVIVNNLDDFLKSHIQTNTLKSGTRVFSKIKGGWFLFYYYD